MDQPIPEWVTNSFFAQCLQKEKANENIVVTNFTVSAPAPPGNNYGSFIFRAKVEYKVEATDTEPHTLSLIVKSELTHGPIKDMLTEMQQSESLFYYKFIPAAKKFTDTNFAATCLSSPKLNVTIIEDLKEKGFVMADRLKQLDFDHCHLYVKAAAELHAVSVPVYKEHPELLKPIKDINILSNDSTMKQSFEVILKYGIKCLADATEEIEKFRKYSALLREFIPKMWDLVVEANKPTKHLKTIRQGDPWTTNMMFKYDDEGNVCEIKLIDFQAIAYGTPINDLIFFLWSSANNEVRKHRLNELYRVYVDTLNEKLKEFNCDERLTFQQLEEEVERLIPMVFSSVTNLPAILNLEPMNFDGLFSKEIDEVRIEQFCRKNYNENYCQNYLPHLLESLELNGIFDFLEGKRT